MRQYNHKTWNRNMIVLEETGCEFARVDPKKQEILWNDWIRLAIDCWLPFVEKKGLEQTEKRFSIVGFRLTQVMAWSIRQRNSLSDQANPARL